jgi:hypothetical protein
MRLAAVPLALLIGCAARQPEPPPEPPPPRALQITPQRRQSRARQDADKADCQSMASSQATSSQTWAQIFVSCMSGRGYRVDDASVR